MDGGNSENGECAIVTLDAGRYYADPLDETVFIDIVHNEAPNDDACLDLDVTQGGATMTGYQMDRIIFPCVDSNDDNLLE